MANDPRMSAKLLLQQPTELESLLKRDVPRLGQPWVVELIVALEEESHAAKNKARKADTLPLWVRALGIVDALPNKGAPLENLDPDLWTNPFAQALSHWLGSTAGLPPLQLFEDWLGDTSRRAASTGPLLLPYLEDPDARSMCLEATLERSDGPILVTLAPRWFSLCGAGMVSMIAALLRTAKPAVEFTCVGVLGTGLPAHDEALDVLLSVALGPKTKASQRAQELLMTVPSRTLDALGRVKATTKQEKIDAGWLSERCQFAMGVAISAKGAKRIQAAEQKKQEQAAQQEAAQKKKMERAEQTRQKREEREEQIRAQLAAKKEAEQAERAQWRAQQAAQYKPIVDKLIADHPKWHGKNYLGRDDFAPLRLHLGKLLRFGWRRYQAEYTHKFITDVIRYFEGQEVRIHLYDDIYWDEIKPYGFEVDSIRLPKPFGIRTEWMDRIWGEIEAARIRD